MLAEELATQVYTWLLQATPALGTLTGWAQATLILLAAIALGQLISYALRKITKLVTQADEHILKEIQQPLAWLLGGVALHVALVPLNLPAAATTIASNSTTTILIGLLAWLLARLTRAVLATWQEFAGKHSQTIKDDEVLPLFSRFIAVVIWTGAFVSILAAWGLAIGPLLAGIGLAGIAIGFAVKDSLANIFGGVSLALDKAYKVGDKVRLEDGTVGIIHEISLRSTRIRTFDGDLVMVPNGKVSNDNIYTFTQPSIRSRVAVDFSIAYGSKVEKAREVILKAIKKIEGIEEEPAPAVHFQEMGDSGLAMRLNFWVPDYNQAIFKKREATQAVYDALNKAKIEIPFPQLTLHMRKK